MVKQTVRECDVCQREKPNLSAYPGLLQPLPIPEKIWSSISMDFIEKLPSSHGKTVILMVVNRLSNYAHFMAMQHPFTTSTVAQVFLDNVYRLHGIPESIVSDKDKIFLSHFWQSLIKVLKAIHDIGEDWSNRRLAKVNNKAVAYVLVKWSNYIDEDATWENYADLIQSLAAQVGRNTYEDEWIIVIEVLLKIVDNADSDNIKLPS
ncbi:reverse transcriptase [Tanacetum coccineum]